MTLISFASAKGSPGVTQTVAGLAALWPRDVIMADLDPIGGDTSVRYRAQDGKPLSLERGLVSLGAALRGGKPAELEDHLQTTEDGMSTLVGVSSPGQVQGLGTTWPHIAAALQTHPVDVLADCGRFAPGSPVTPVIERSAALVFVARSDMAALAHLRERLLALQEPLRIGAIDGVPVAVVLVGDPRDSRSVDDTARLLAAAGLRVQSLGVVSYDPKTVQELQSGSRRSLRRSLLVRSLTDITGRIQSMIASHDRDYQEAR